MKNHEVAEVKIKDRPRRWGRSHYGLSRIREVLRELVTIPFITKGVSPKRLDQVFKAFLVFLTLFMILCLAYPRALLLAPIPIVATAILMVTNRNLQRFHRAQKEGVFRVRELE